MLIYKPQNVDLAISRSNGVVKAKEISALDEASLIVHAAEEKAAEIVASAQAHFQDEKERGYLEGREAAEKEAIARLLNEQVHLDTRLQVLEAGLADVVKTSIRTILADFNDAQLVEKTTATALQKMRRSSHLQIHLPPLLIETFEPIVRKLEHNFTEIHKIELTADAELTAPNFIIESAGGRIEFNLGDKLDVLDALIDETVAAFALETSSGETCAGQLE